MPSNANSPSSKRKREDDGVHSDDDEHSDRYKDAEEDVETKRQRIIGPAMPPGSDAEDSEDESSDDDVGPFLPGTKLLEPQPLQQVQQPESAEKKSQREAWMLAPPESGDWTKSVDPTRIKNRKFTSGKSNKPAQGSDVPSIWTETPDQKRKRLAEEVMGVARPANQGPEVKAASTAQDEETARRIKQYNDANRGESLVSQHRSQATATDDDPSKRAFDREKDIGGRQIGEGQKREMLKRAANLGSKFSSGKYL